MWEISQKYFEIKVSKRDMRAVSEEIVLMI